MNQVDYKKLTFGIKEASAATNLSRALLFEKIAAGELKSFKIGNRRLIHADDLDTWLNTYRQQGSSHAS